MSVKEFMDLPGFKEANVEELESIGITTVEQLRDAVQETLNEMVKDGTFMEIANHYADDSLPDMVCLGK